MRFLDALTLLFIGLKLTGHIDWSWFWVLLPRVLSFIAWSIYKTIEEYKDAP